jgi:hypothetical protein
MQSAKGKEISKKGMTDTPRDEHVLIGKLPTYKQVIGINGLLYRVKFVNRKAGEVTLKLLGAIPASLQVQSDTIDTLPKEA